LGPSGRGTAQVETVKRLRSISRAAAALRPLIVWGRRTSFNASAMRLVLSWAMLTSGAISHRVFGVARRDCGTPKPYPDFTNVYASNSTSGRCTGTAGGGWKAELGWDLLCHEGGSRCCSLAPQGWQVPTMMEQSSTGRCPPRRGRVVGTGGARWSLSRHGHYSPQSSRAH
jgi:hypothetical protein